MRKGWVTLVVIVGSVATLSAQITDPVMHTNPVKVYFIG
jgi:hypothetical protein